MAINKKLIHFKTFANFNSLKLSANEANTKYTIGVNNTVYDGSPNILYQSICYIKDRKLLWTHGQLYCDSEELKEELNKIAKRVDENEEVTSNAIFNLQEAIETNELITTEAISDIQENINILDSVIVEFSDNLETQNYIITDIFESIENLDKVVSASLEHINQVIEDNEESITASMLALNDKIPTKVSLLDNDISYVTEKFVADKFNNFKTINGNSILGNGDVIIPNEIEFINISRKLLDNSPIYTIGEIKPIIYAYNTNKLIAIKSSDDLAFGKGWFIPNIRITNQEERYYTIYLSGVIGYYYFEHNILYDSIAGIISVTVNKLTNLSENASNYVVCSTDSDADIKEINIPNMTFGPNARIWIEFTNGNTYPGALAASVTHADGTTSLPFNFYGCTGQQPTGSGNSIHYKGIMFPAGVYEFEYYNSNLCFTGNYVSEKKPYISVGSSVASANTPTIALDHTLHTVVNLSNPRLLIFTINDSSTVHDYSFEFTTGTTDPTVTFPSVWKWANGTAPTITTNKTYHVSVVNNCAVIAEF